MQSRRSKVEHPHNITLDDDIAVASDVDKNTLWYTHPAIQWSLNIAAFLSLVSVCFNTPQTFKVSVTVSNYLVLP